ncbi:tetratricopeptide repeat protein [Mesohalobacter halotolerans]|uniref:Tetratricopeptide repeat protein n=1 Tax=Mesohalobacter halotolerans TaxID=1883405 RepID=A0A4U5TR52_9FLAO|nr:tetratricopeptide repeat protein [Mesohalobacter halotolerans]TKS55854.1 tetratricopeptide repeat protein [Mesohalobacter halotolerans]
MKNILVIILFFYFQICFSQIKKLNIDSIANYILTQKQINSSNLNPNQEEAYYMAYKKMSPSEQFERLLEISKQLKFKKNYKKSIEVLNFALKHYPYPSSKINTLHLLKASNFNALGLYDSVSFYLDKVKTFSTFQQELSYKNLKADLLTNRGNHVESIKIYLELLDDQRKMSETKLLSISKSLGVAYLKIQNFEKAKFYFKKLLNHEKDTNTIYRAEDHINLAVCYKEQDSLDKAGFHYLKSLAIAKANDNDFLSAQVFSNLGNLEVRKKNFVKAEDYIDMSLQICKKHELKIGIIINKVNLSNLYIQKGDYKEAYKIINKIDVDFVNKSAPDLKTEFYKNRSLIYEQFNDTESALVDYKYYIKLIDSAYSRESLYKIKNIELESFEKQKLKEIEILENSIKDKQTRQVYLLILIFFLMLILTLSYFVFKLNIRKKTLKNKVLSQQVELKNKEVLAMVLKHNQYKEARKKYVQEINQLINNNSNREKIKKYLKSIDYENNHFNWNEFDIYFKETHKSFFDNLIEKYPELTTNELRICALLKLNMNSKEISNLTSRSRGSIDNIRSSIRKKMQLEPDQNLSVYLNSFDN